MLRNYGPCIVSRQSDRMAAALQQKAYNGCNQHCSETPFFYRMFRFPEEEGERHCRPFLTFQYSLWSTQSPTPA